ncbi:hypothetical protein OZX72_05510 [Bifidobacterium sp. ESL0769]|uniref:hypothetical protein n=1 Tax=Bifidobacterium sp. ESL0769 TaxID=2983229 RepID=UPI0023F8FD3E|nr:hypothetical protein [Bifidobacterium sp. ESL0769]WEV66729.1 hypothetical protein OZX72_05510 [Bifidobacterium sp. ESL0769]
MEDKNEKFELFYSKAKAYYEQGNLKEALRFAKKANKLHRIDKSKLWCEDSSFLRLVAAIYAQMGDVKNYCWVEFRISELNPNDFEQYATSASAFEEWGSLNMALQQYKKAIEVANKQGCGEDAIVDVCYEHILRIENGQ